MAIPPLSGIHHVKVPVVDLDQAIDWYKRVFDFNIEWEFPDDDRVTIHGVGGTVPGAGFLALRLNPTAAEGCKGVDLFGFAVDGPADLEAWIEHLDRLGIEHSPLIQASKGWLLVFHDLNGIEIHLYTWADHGEDLGHLPGYGRRVAESR